MITGVRSANIYVDDQERAKRFFTQTLGFTLVRDVPMGNDARWIEVTPPDGHVLLVLFTEESARSRIGTFSNVMFTCDDVQRTHEELSARGVEFAETPSLQSWGWWAAFEDPDGNTYGLTQAN